MLKRISFAILKIKKGRKAEFRAILAKMPREDADKKVEEVLEKVKV